LLALGSKLDTPEYRHLWLALLGALPLPAILMLLLRRGGMFSRLQRALVSLIGMDRFSESAAALDETLRSLLGRFGTLLAVGGLQFAALVLTSLEIWLAMRWFGHPIGLSQAVILESTTQAVRHLAFVVPAGLGVQEAGMVAFGHLLGISPELALAVSVAKRLREILCGLPFLGSWQWLELVYARQPPRVVPP
jgi:uncharacterized membrane protein YbhN (UPF0104 family)